jgi:hypothetical protein
MPPTWPAFIETVQREINRRGYWSGELQVSP